VKKYLRKVTGYLENVAAMLLAILYNVAFVSILHTIAYYSISHSISTKETATIANQ